MDVEVTNRTKEKISARSIEKTVKRAARKIGFPRGAMISVVFVDAAKTRYLNNEYRGKDEATDVLSFRLEDGKKEFISPKFVRGVYGEIFLCAEEARKRAAERGRDYASYLNLLIVHALLHLKGMDHKIPKEAKIMEEKEREIIDKIKNKI